ncbi:MAG: hypothetical protein JWM43_2593 [Acidobacteriaceae bacterium]|nr:hypothetical protein [Acidobacteriaceae bacterium]
MSFRHVACVVVALQTFVYAASQDVPPQIPKQWEAIAPNQNFSSAKTITVAVSSRRTENADTSADLERIRRRVLERLPKIPLTVVTEKASADLWLEIIVEPNVRYGMFHSQNAPYVYVTLREPSGGHLVYCAYQREGHFVDTSENLLRNLESNMRRKAPSPSGSLAACAEQAMRPL